MIRSVIRNAKYVLHKRGMMPIYLLLGATYRCNARCITCFNSEKLNKRAQEELKIEEHRRIASGMGPITWLLFTGGEPTLRDDLARIAEVYYLTNYVERITVPVNALLPERTRDMAAEIVDRCRRSRVAFSLAIDGAGELHDSIRGVKGNFGALLETYKLLVEIRRRERRFSINLNTVLMDRNIGHLDELMRFVSDNMPDADFHGFEVLRGSPPEKDLRPPTPEQYREALRKLIPYWARFPFYRGPLRRLLRAAKIEARLMELEALKGIGPDMPCHAGRISCVIDALGDLYFCEELTTPIGNLRDLGYDFGKLWYSEESERLRRFVAEKGCRCTHSCFLGSSLMFEPRYYGRLLRRVMITSRYKL